MITLNGNRADSSHSSICCSPALWPCSATCFWSCIADHDDDEMTREASRAERSIRASSSSSMVIQTTHEHCSSSASTFRILQTKHRTRPVGIMHFLLTSVPFLAVTAAALSARPALDSRDECKIPTCPKGWSASACNTGVPDFCCPGGSHISKGSASCCIGGNLFDNRGECSGGVLVPVGSDPKAYTSSVYSALSSISGSGGGMATTASATDSASASQTSAETVTTTDSSGKTVTTTGQAAATTSSTAAAAAMITGYPAGAAGLAAVMAIVNEMA